MAAHGPIGDLTVVVQAGGLSTRLGYDKARASFAGRPLIERVLERVAPVASELVVTTPRPAQLDFLEGFAPEGTPVRVAADLPGGPGAMRGIASSLSAAATPLVAILACDMPFASPDLISALAARLRTDGLDACVPRTHLGIEPLCAVWRRASCLPHALALLEACRQRIFVLLDAVRTGYFEEGEAAAAAGGTRCFINVNTRADLLRAERLALEGPDGVGPGPLLTAPSKG